MDMGHTFAPEEERRKREVEYAAAEKKRKRTQGESLPLLGKQSAHVDRGARILLTIGKHQRLQD